MMRKLESMEFLSKILVVLKFEETNLTGFPLFRCWSSEQPDSLNQALSPFERVAVQQRCRTKYLLTPSTTGSRCVFRSRDLDTSR